jgi:hypothetical protein
MLRWLIVDTAIDLAAPLMAKLPGPFAVASPLRAIAAWFNVAEFSAVWTMCVEVLGQAFT